MRVFPLLLAAALAALDQWTKYLVVQQIEPHATHELLPGVFNLTFEKNTGAAWSLLSEHTWLLTIASSLVALLVVFALLRPLVRHPLGRWALAVTLGGAVGNLIDRIRLGYVVDMLQTTFIRFPVFNVADICVVTGGILFCIYVLFFYETHEKRGMTGYGYGLPGGRYRGRKRPR